MGDFHLCHCQAEVLESPPQDHNIVSCSGRRDLTVTGRALMDSHQMKSAHNRHHAILQLN